VQGAPLPLHRARRVAARLDQRELGQDVLEQRGQQVGYLVCGAGYGLAIAVLPRLVNAAGPVAQSGSANGANTVARTVGGALGSQIGAAMVAGAALPGSGYTPAFGFAAVVAGLGALLPLLGRVRTSS
jgi:hypothetical protein